MAPLVVGVAAPRWRSFNALARLLSVKDDCFVEDLLAQHPNYRVLLGHHSVVADDELLLGVTADADGMAAFGRIQLSSATCFCRYNDNNNNNNNNNNNQPHLLLA
jgi:hypothetical protein